MASRLEALRARVLKRQQALHAEASPIKRRAVEEEKEVNGQVQQLQLASLFELCPPDLAGVIAEYLWGFSEKEIILDSGMIIKKRKMLPELGELLCTGHRLATRVVVGCKERRAEASKRSVSDMLVFDGQIDFLQGFKDLWARSREIRMKKTNDACYEEAMAFLTKITS